MQRVRTGHRLVVVFATVGAIMLWSAHAGSRPASADSTSPQKSKPALLSAYYGLDDAMPTRANLICPGSGGMDGMPVVFRGQIDQSTLQDEDLIVRTESGERRIPLCASLAPADEEDEDRTILLLGDLGDATADPPSEVLIDGWLRTESGRQLHGSKLHPITGLEAGPSLVFASTKAPVDSATATELGCTASTKRLVRVTWDAGITPATGTEAELAGSYQVSLKGRESPVRPIALADLDDSDNNHLLCLEQEARATAIVVRSDRVLDPGEDANAWTRSRVR